MTAAELHRARRLLCALQDHIRDALIAAREKGTAGFARVAAVTAADTIYRVDRIGERAIFAWFEKNWPRRWPVELVMEGLEGGAPAVFPRGTLVARTVFKCILDPIDGTRNLMFDKRSAWTLAALAPQRGAETGLADIVVAAMTELPTAKQWRADQLSAVRGGGPRGLVAEAVDLRSGRRRKFFPRRSRARDFRHGFASLVKFFPEGKSLLARVEEELWSALYGRNHPTALVFDDQYLTTGGAGGRAAARAARHDVARGVDGLRERGAGAAGAAGAAAADQKIFVSGRRKSVRRKDGAGRAAQFTPPARRRCAECGRDRQDGRA